MVGKRLRSLIAEYLTKRLVKAVTDDQIITISGREWLHNRRRLSQEEILGLKEDASRFLDSPLWEYMKKDIEWQAWQRMGPKATVPEDLIFGKAMFYDLDLIRKYCERLKSL